MSSNLNISTMDLDWLSTQTGQNMFWRVVWATNSSVFAHDLLVSLLDKPDLPSHVKSDLEHAVVPILPHPQPDSDLNYLVSVTLRCCGWDPAYRAPNGLGPGCTDCRNTDGVEGDLRCGKCVGETQERGYQEDLPKEELCSLQERERSNIILVSIIKRYKKPRG